MDTGKYHYYGSALRLLPDCMPVKTGAARCRPVYHKAPTVDTKDTLACQIVWREYPV
ncbi:MAG: hypothetical protein GY697_13330 [Desulfobacterales bacterium]|nr:hypothetical protein [Desulfobacterales bacterium]